MRYSRRNRVIATLCWTCTAVIFLFLFGLTFHYQPYEPEGCNDCFKRPYIFTINPDKTCSDAENLDALIVIFSRAENLESRAVVRRTWLATAHNLPNVTVRHVFLLGLPQEHEHQPLIAQESTQYGDIVQQSFSDTYNNLTLKSLAGLEWATDHCSQAKFIIKIDEDVFVNVSLLISAIWKTPNADFNILGRCIKNGTPLRNPLSRYYVSPDEYKFSLYPPFCTGPVYALSMPVARAILLVSPHVPFFRLEDLYMGMCLFNTPYGVITIKDILLEGNPTTLNCDNLETLIAHHSVTPVWLSQMWQRCGFYSSRL